MLIFLAKTTPQYGTGILLVIINKMNIHSNYDGCIPVLIGYMNRVDKSIYEKIE